MTDRPDDRMDDDGAPPPPASSSSQYQPPPAADHVRSETASAAAAAQQTAEPTSAPDPTPAAVPAMEKLPPAFPRRRMPLVPILLAAVGVLLVLVVLLGLMAFAPRISPIKSSATKLAVAAQEEQAIEAVARRFARNFVTIDYRSIDEDLDRMSADATGNFQDQLDRTIRAIGEEFEKRKARSTGRALDSAVLSHEGGTALVQVLLRRTKENVGTKGPETGNQIVNVSLVRTDEGWKVDNLSQLGAEEP